MPKFEVRFEVRDTNPPSLREVQEFVGGYVELLELNNGDQLLFNEEGKIKRLPINEEATLFYRANFGHRDFIVGNAMLLKGPARWE